MATERETERRDWTVLPGEILAEALEERQMSQSELARRMARPEKTISEIVNGKAAITAETAIQLERVLGISAGFWNGVEARFREHRAREHERKLAKSTNAWAARFPVRELQDFGVIPRRDSGEFAGEDLLAFFAVSSPRGWQLHWASLAADFRRPRRLKASSFALTAWLRWGEIESGKQQTGAYDRERFMTLIPTLARLSRKTLFDSAIRQVQRECAGAGVLIVVTPELAGVRASGVARWTKGGRPLIQLSLRYRSDDQFWFSLVHECVHVLQARQRVNQLDDLFSENQEDDDIEEEVNALARDIILPPHELDLFVNIGDFSAHAVRMLAKKVGVSPGLVVGRLQRDGLVSWSALNHLKVMYAAPGKVAR